MRRAHNDYTEWSGPQRVRDIVPDEAEDLLTRRFAIVQVWRPIRYPVENLPAGDLRCAAALRSTTFIISERIYQDRKGQTYACAYNPNHHWYWFPRMRREEALVFKVYNFPEGGRRALDRAHRVRGPDHAAERAPAREHRDQDPGVFLSASAAIQRLSQPFAAHTRAARISAARSPRIALAMKAASSVGKGNFAS